MRNKIKDVGSYLRITGFCVLLFLAFNFLTFHYADTVTNSLDLTQSYNVVDAFEITFPRTFQWLSDDAKAQNPLYYG